MKRNKWNRAVDAWVRGGFTVCQDFDAKEENTFVVKRGPFGMALVITVRALDLETVERAVEELKESYDDHVAAAMQQASVFLVRSLELPPVPPAVVEYAEKANAEAFKAGCECFWEGEQNDRCPLHKRTIETVQRSEGGKLTVTAITGNGPRTILADPADIVEFEKGESWP